MYLHTSTEYGVGGMVGWARTRDAVPGPQGKGDGHPPAQEKTDDDTPDTRRDTVGTRPESKRRVALSSCEGAASGQAFTLKWRAPAGQPASPTKTFRTG